MSDNLAVWVIGAGVVAAEYAKVLKALNIPFKVIGRGESSARAFRASSGIDAYIGGIDAWLAQGEPTPANAIVAVSADQLSYVTNRLIQSGVKRVLTEKPAGLCREQIESIAANAGQYGAEVYIAYNRRYYASVLKAEEMITDDGGVKSFTFEFTEWSHQIETLEHPLGILPHWFLANSTHVVDTAFFLGGRPKQFTAFTAGALSWHPNAIYSGAGVTETGALFSYHANWAAPGRWGIEINTRKHRLIFRPLEKLQVQVIGALSAEYANIDDSLDKEFKPGFYRQTEDLVSGKSDGRQLSIVEYLKLLSVYEKMNNGTV